MLRAEEPGNDSSNLTDPVLHSNAFRASAREPSCSCSCALRSANQSICVSADRPLQCEKLELLRGSLTRAHGADASSRIFYNRVKGELDRAVSEVGFRSLINVGFAATTSAGVPSSTARPPSRPAPGPRSPVVAWSASRPRSPPVSPRSSSSAKRSQAEAEGAVDARRSVGAAETGARVERGGSPSRERLGLSIREGVVATSRSHGTGVLKCRLVPPAGADIVEPRRSRG